MYVCFNMISFSFSGGGGVGRLWFLVCLREITISYHKINYLCILCFRLNFEIQKEPTGSYVYVPDFFPQQVAQMSSFIAPLADLAVGAASRTADVQRKVDLLDQAKTVAESAAQLMYATKEGGGNPKVKSLYYCVWEVRLKIESYG